MALPNPNIHRVVITFDDGVRATLICPESGCVPPHSCGSCGRSLDDTETTPCYDCSGPGPAPDECWVKTWFDNCSADELLRGTFTVEISPEWDGDSLLAHIVGVVPDRPDATQADPQAEGPSTINPGPPSSSSTGEDHGGVSGLDSDGSPTAPDGLAAGTSERLRP